MITDRLRFTVIEVNTNNVLTRDLVVKEPKVTVNLSAPSSVSFSIDQGQQYGSSFGINWKNWGQWIIPELATDQFGKIVLGAQLVTHNQIDPKTGDLQIDATGFLGYPKGIPWLENFNPIAVDPAEVIQRIWAQIQSYTNAQLGVDVVPSSTGTQMLPGYGFDGNILSFDFFAMFIRASDFVDAGDQMFALARDLPLDLFEEASWNNDRSAINKQVRIAYPLGGLQQDYLSFRLGENVINCELADELEIEPVSDIIIRSWLPGKVYSSQLANSDPTRVRRVAMEEDASINSSERAAAWGHRKLTRRNIPTSFQKITIDPNHPNAPFGSFGVGDSIFIEAPNFPWKGDIKQWHRVTSITVSEESLMEIGVKVDGAFNYDPIIYDPDAEEQPQEDLNLLSNGYFAKSFAGWYMIKGTWIRMGSFGYTNDGCVRIDCDDHGENLQSEKIAVNPNETLHFEAAVKWQEITYSGTPAYTFAIGATPFLNGGAAGSTSIIGSILYNGVGGWRVITGNYTVPIGGVNEVALNLIVHDNVTGGIAFWDDAKVLR